MGRQTSFMQEGGGFDELMRCDSIQLPNMSLFFEDHSMPSGHVLISFAVVACA